MQDKQTNSHVSERGNDARPATPERSSNGQATDVHPDQELVYRLKSAIDQRGRYSFRLNDIAAGFASGRSVTPATARQTIEKSFTEQFGLSPQQYLDRHYDERRLLGNEISRSRQRNNGQDRGR